MNGDSPNSFSVGRHRVGIQHSPLMVAEISGNHNQSLDRALALVDAAADAGADAVKLQTYTADTMTLDMDQDDFFISDPGSLWKGKTLYQLYKEAHTPWEWHRPIIDRCQEHGLEWFSTPFDNTAVDFLETFDPPVYKIASFENVDLPLIKKAASTGKPLIISTGMANLDEIGEAVSAARNAGCTSMALLHCVSSYPAPAEEYNLKILPDLEGRFQVLPGLSDHTPGITVSVAAIALGARVIEKHFTLRRADGGPDAAFSLEPEEFRKLCTACRTAFQALGRAHYEQVPSEKQNLKFRRSIYAVRDIEPGEKLTVENIRTIRPGFGLPPKHWEDLIGKTAQKRITRGTPLTWELIKD